MSSLPSSLFSATYFSGIGRAFTFLRQYARQMADQPGEWRSQPSRQSTSLHHLEFFLYELVRYLIRPPSSHATFGASLVIQPILDGCLTAF
jgi:hypothetical protein